MRAVIRGHEERSVQFHQTRRSRTGAPDPNVPHQRRAGPGAIALPDFAPVDSVLRGEIEGAVQGDQVERVRRRSAVAGILHQHGARRSAIALPQFATGHAIVRGEEQRSVHGGQVEGRRADAAAADVFDENRARRSAIALPQFHAVHAIVRGEVKRASHVDQVGRSRCSAAGQDVPDQAGARRSAVALPQLEAGGAVVRREVKRAVHIREARGNGTETAGANVLHQRGARRSAVALPQFHAAHAVVGGEVERAVDVGEIRRIGTELARGRGAADERLDVLHQYGAGRSAVARPQFAPDHAVIGREEQDSIRAGQPQRGGAARPRANVLHQDRAGFRAVRGPQLHAVHAVVGREVERAVHIDEDGGVGTAGPGQDVFHQHGASRAAVGLPKLNTVHAIVRREIQGSADSDQVGRRGIGGAVGDVLHETAVAGQNDQSALDPGHALAVHRHADVGDGDARHFRAARLRALVDDKVACEHRPALRDDPQAGPDHFHPHKRSGGNIHRHRRAGDHHRLVHRDRAGVDGERDGAADQSDARQVQSGIDGEGGRETLWRNDQHAAAVAHGDVGGGAIAKVEGEVCRGHADDLVTHAVRRLLEHEVAAEALAGRGERRPGATDPHVVVGRHDLVGPHIHCERSGETHIRNIDRHIPAEAAVEAGCGDGESPCAVADANVVSRAVAKPAIDIGQGQLGHPCPSHGSLGEREVAAQFLRGNFDVDARPGQAQERPLGKNQLHRRAGHEDALLHRRRGVVEFQRQRRVDHNAWDVHPDGAAQTPGHTGSSREKGALAIREANEGVRAIAEA